MTPDTFMDTFTLVRNRLEKQDTRFREVFPIEMRVAIVFRSNHKRCSMKKDFRRNFTKFTGKHPCQGLFFNKVAGLKPASLLKKRLWHRCFPVNFAKFLKTFYLQNTSGRLLLCFKNVCCCKIDCGKHYRLSKYLIKFPRTPTGTAKAIATFKETVNCKIP